LLRNEFVKSRSSKSGIMCRGESVKYLPKQPDLCRLFCAKSEQRGSAQKRQPTDDRWKRYVLRGVSSGMNRPHIEHFFLAGVTEPLVDQRKYPKNDEQNSQYGG